MRDVWKSGLEWYIYMTNREQKAKYALIIMRVKDKLSGIANKGDLARHYIREEGLCEEVVAQLFPNDNWFDFRRTEDVAYGLRCLELSTGKTYDLFRQTPSRWLIETVA